MDETSQKQAPKNQGERNKGQPSSFNSGHEDAKKDIHPTGATGVDSIQGGTTDTHASNHPAEADANADVQGRKSKAGEDVRQNTQSAPRTPSRRKAPEINSDNDGSVFNGDTVG